MTTMAVPPSNVGARFRQRKISVKQTLQILKLSEVPDLEKEDQQRELQHVETGVEKHEESEVHLQRIMLNMVSGADTGSGHGSTVEAEPRGRNKKKDDKKKKDNKNESSDIFFIPTPDASKLWKESKKYYLPVFVLPSSYVKMSATVEDTSGVQYCMDEADDVFLQKFNKELIEKNFKALLEDEFEIIMDTFERVVAEKQPFLSIDPTEILTFVQIKDYALAPNPTSRAAVRERLKEDLHVDSLVTILDAPDVEQKSKEQRSIGDLLDNFGPGVYEYWKNRRIELEGSPIMPQLKFDEPSDKGNNSGEDDPYVCFRHREFRQQRKTRKTDIQSAEKLRRLHMELKSVNQLVMLVARRELRRQESLKLEKKVFDNRCKVKTLKRELGIKGEEEDLVQHKKKKIILPPKEDDKELKKLTGHRLQRSSNLAEEARRRPQQSLGNITAQPYVKLPASKIPDMELETVSQVLLTKNNSIERAVNEKLIHRQQNENNKDWINLTDDCYNPFFALSDSNGADIKEHSHLPYSSIVSSLFEIQTSNYLDSTTRDLLKNGKYAPNTSIAFDGKDGQVIDQDEFHSLFDIINTNKDNQNLLLPEVYNPYRDESKPNVSEPLFRMRKRMARGGRTMVDRRGLIKKSDFKLSDFIDEDALESCADEDQYITKKVEQDKGSNIYDSKIDKFVRFDSRWKYDNDYSESMIAETNPFGSDPSKLNCISNDTQSIRFGSMLLSKAYESFREAQYQRQQVLVQNRRRMQLLQQQRLQQINQTKKKQNDQPSQHGLLQNTPPPQKQPQQLQPLSQQKQVLQVVH